MSDAQIQGPFQYRNTRAARLLRWLLHTKIGAFFGFHLGIAGFNRPVWQISRFVRYYTPGEKLKRNEIVKHVKRDDGVEFDGVYRSRPEIRYAFNSRVDAGAALVAYLLTNSNLGSLTTPSFPLYIANSNTSLTPAKGDTTLSGEISTNGLGRHIGTVGTYTAPSVVDGGASYVLSYTWTASGSQGVTSSAIFDAASTGNMLAEANLNTTATLAANDQLTVNWTINF